MLAVSAAVASAASAVPGPQAAAHVDVKDKASLVTLRIALPGVGGYLATVYVAKIEGLFKQQGIDAQFSQVGGNTVPLVVSGQEDLAVLGAGVALVPVASGKSTSIIYGATGSLESGFFAGGTGVSSPADCKRIATSQIGASGYNWAAAYEDLAHSHPNIVQYGDASAIAASVISGQNDCIVNGYTTIAPALSSSFHIVYDPRNPKTMPTGTPNRHGIGVSIWGLTDRVKQLRPTLAKFIFALRKAEALIRKWSPETLSNVLRKNSDWQVFTPDAVVQTVTAEKPFLSPNHGYVNAGVWPGELSWVHYGLPSLNPSDPVMSWNNRVDMTPWLQANKMYLRWVKRHKR